MYVDGEIENCKNDCSITLVCFNEKNESHLGDSDVCQNHTELKRRWHVWALTRHGIFFSCDRTELLSLKTVIEVVNTDSSWCTQNNIA